MNQAKLILTMVLLFFVGFTSTSGAEPDPPTLTSSDLSAVIDRAKVLAIAAFPSILPKNFSPGYVSTYFASRSNSAPDGIMVSFPIRGSHRREELGEMEDRVIVIFPDEANKKPDVKKISRWLNKDSITRTEYRIQPNNKGADQPATAPESKSEGDSKPEPESKPAPR